MTSAGQRSGGPFRPVRTTELAACCRSVAHCIALVEMPANVRLLPISSVPRSVPTLARVHYAEWGALLPWWSLAAAEEELADHARSDRPYPSTIVAVGDTVRETGSEAGDLGELVGSVSLVDDDLPEYPHIRPWLASLYVIPAFRGAGVGRLLVDACTCAARASGFGECHLFTAGQEDFYARQGWEVTERIDYHGHAGTLMRYRLT